MAVDFQVVFPQEAVALTSVRYNAQTGLLDVIGQDFSAVDEVLVNELPSANVVVLSRTNLLASLPSSVSAAQVTDIAVLSRRLTITPRSLMRFRIGKTPSFTTGILKLVQLFLKMLFTTPGQDIFSPTLGGGALKNLGETYGANEGGRIVSDFVLSVSTASRQIVALQSRSNLPRDERLLSAKVLSSSYDRKTSSLIVSVEIVSQAGRMATANLVV